MPLRLRLLLVLVGIVAVGLIVADAVTYTQLDSFLYGRTDQQLAGSADAVGDALTNCLEGVGPFLNPAVCNQYVDLGPGSLLPTGTWGALLDSNGDYVGGAGVFFGTAQSEAATPNLPNNLPGSSSGPTGAAYFSTTSTGTPTIHYRVLAEAVNGGTLVIAFPTTDVTGTLQHLVGVEAFVTIAVLAALGCLAWWIVRRGLRPLDDMADTAMAIAKGDLTRRVAVPDDGAQTEVGQLGIALNAMLANIETAFAAQEASEERLRRFLADASHELRTPLTSIRGYAEMFDRGIRDRPEDLATSMHHIRSEADRMSELVNDLLLLARLDQERPLEHETFDFGAVVAQAVQSARVVAPDRAIAFAGPGTLQMEGDAGRIRQVADNLLTNALRHTPPGTPIEVRLGSQSGQALLEMEDHGAGVAPEDRERIFEPFHRADVSRARSTGGMGLGLSIVAAIARAHGGSVGVRSGAAGGAVFWVRLPLVRPAVPPPAARPASPPAHGNGSAAPDGHTTESDPPVDLWAPPDPARRGVHPADAGSPPVPGTPG
ncbi:MAG TPA: HAMP domain-containing sensor histidine kinase [Acidimicrobiales bacterium]|nr:HAMP domain-containing sensor histidine kinase [Acidimicrobiales bacterium]